MGKQGPRTSYLLVSVLLLIVVAFAVSYYRYMHTLNYDLFLTGPCDASVEVCVSYEEERYAKYLVSAQDIALNCKSLDADSCIDALIGMNLAVVQDCEEFLDEGESCTDPTLESDGESVSDVESADASEPEE